MMMETSGKSKSKHLILQLEKQENSDVLNLNDLYLGKNNQGMKVLKI